MRHKTRHQPPSSWSALQASHRSISGNTIRAAVLGANDGLVSNLSLVAGVAGAALAAQTILITGFAGLAAGSCAMAMGEWISVQTSREVNERELRVETEELRRFPEEETDELTALYESRGLAPAGARQLAESVIADGSLALEVMAREELGIDPNQLGGSPWKAAASSFIMFCLGAFVPLVPFVFASRKPALITSVALSAIILLALRAAVTILTGRSPLRSAIRQLLFGLGAAAITYAIGHAVGSVVS
ncbi:MAG: VIT1/CCC1 transporter family protein [Gaiellales bacterium]